MNNEQAGEVFHVPHESLFALIEQLQMPHPTVYQAVKLSYQLQQTVLSLCVCVAFVYVVSEAESLIFGFLLGLKELLNIVQSC